MVLETKPGHPPFSRFAIKDHIDVVVFPEAFWHSKSEASEISS